MKVFDVKHPEEYTSGGETKTRWVMCGAIIKKANGKHVLKMDVMPVNSDGWFQLFEPEPREDAQPQRPAPQPQQPTDGFEDSSIPF